MVIGCENKLNTRGGRVGVEDNENILKVGVKNVIFASRGVVPFRNRNKHRLFLSSCSN